MKGTTIVRIGREHVRHVARLRGIAGLEAAEAGDTVWLRSSANDESLNQLLAGLGGERFELLDGERLVPWQARVPTERLPPLRWTSIAKWATIALPIAALPGRLVPRQPLRVVRGGAERPSAALLTVWRCWFDYATTAPEIRLRPLAFALAEDGRVLIRGTPLPPLSGQPYAVDRGVAVPCGWSLSPALESAIVCEVLGLAEGDIALFATDGTFERIAGEHFVRASRSAVRASGEGAAHA
ncbi:MAG TPA: hypothetical protein VHC22_15480 [Pirellulales bacterium]|nr:hypothetical protein [Pirellulales bacterium]